MSDHINSGFGPAFDRIDPNNVTNGQLLMLLYNIKSQQIQTGMQLEELKEQIKAGELKQRDMIRTWETSKNVLAFIKMLAALGIPIAVCVTGVKFVLSKFGI